MKHRSVHVPQILMPREGIDLYKWAIVACDQYTSQPEYWEKTDWIVGDAPSTLRLTLPEVYLESKDIDSRIESIHSAMREYTQNGVLSPLPAGMVLTERFSGGTFPRHGLIVSVDLEDYDYHPASHSPIRPTEKTVVERIPPRLKVRKGATLELPHIMLLIDDPKRTVIEPLFDRKGQFKRLYSTDLMQGGGHINGYFIPEGAQTDAILDSFDVLCDRQLFNQKYRLESDLPLLPFAVGDGNHSMATAKAYWEDIKKTLTPAQQENHPARFALVEVVNIHDESLCIEPIHRVMFQIDPDQLLSAAKEFYAAHGCTAEVTRQAPADTKNAHYYPFCTAQEKSWLVVRNPQWTIPLATLQTFLDDYLAHHPDAKIDYIHGLDVVESLGTQIGNMGFLLPDIAKNDLFRGVVIDGVLPRKTFSMGEAHEKRFYMEAKAIL